LDLAIALKRKGIEPARVIEAFAAYMEHGGHLVTRALFERNMHQKLQDAQFAADIGPLLASGYSWDMEAVAEAVGADLIRRLPGEPWSGGA
jgi:hypothetical protein